MSTGGVGMNDTNCNSRYSVLLVLLFTNHVFNILEVEIALIC